jgi:hypothetical protein
MGKRTVFLYGHSMLLTLVAKSLAESPGLHIFHPEAWGELEALLKEYDPDVLIYDLEDATQNNILPLLIQNPRMRLIGLDVETNRAVLVAGQETRSLTLERVREIIDLAAPEE